MDERSTIVYSTETGRIKEKKEPERAPEGDGIVRISLKRLGGSKAVSVVTGLALEAEDLKEQIGRAHV